MLIRASAGLRRAITTFRSQRICVGGDDDDRTEEGGGAVVGWARSLWRVTSQRLYHDCMEGGGIKIE